MQTETGGGQMHSTSLCIRQSLSSWATATPMIHYVRISFWNLAVRIQNRYIHYTVWVCVVPISQTFVGRYICTKYFDRYSSDFGTNFLVFVVNLFSGKIQLQAFLTKSLHILHGFMSLLGGLTLLRVLYKQSDVGRLQDKLTGTVTVVQILRSY